MTQYLVAIHHPDDYDPSVAEDEAMERDIDTLNGGSDGTNGCARGRRRRSRRSFLATTPASPSGRGEPSLIRHQGWRLERFASEDDLAAMTDNCLAGHVGRLGV